jgi:cytochrome c-type biogenesis protein CcmE
MHKKVRNRLLISLTVIALMASGAYLILFYLSDNIVFFIKPSEITETHMGKKIRIGGLVKEGSVVKGSPETIFILIDNEKEIRVKYIGILPALFREGQGMVAEGFLENRFEITSKRLLTKHDENYKPPKSKEKK